MVGSGEFDKEPLGSMTDRKFLE